MAALQSHSSFRGQSERAVGGGEPREDLGWGKLNRSHGERSVGREQQAHAHESRGGEPRERPMPGVHATRRGHLALPCVTLPLPMPANRALLARSHPRIATPAEPFCFFLSPLPPPSLVFFFLFLRFPQLSQCFFAVLVSLLLSSLLLRFDEFFDRYFRLDETRKI